MKLFARLMLAALVIAMLLPFTILKDDSGKTLMSFSDFSLPDFSLPAMSNTSTEFGQGADLLRGENTIYQWRDSNGNLNFTSQPPPPGVEFEVRRFDPAANVIQSVQLPSTETVAEPGGKSADTASADPAEVGSLYSGEGIQKLFEDARNLEKVLGQRFKDQDTAISQ